MITNPFHFLTHRKDTNKQVINMTFTSIFFATSVSFLEIYLKDTNKQVKYLPHLLKTQTKTPTGKVSLSSVKSNWYENRN